MRISNTRLRHLRIWTVFSMTLAVLHTIFWGIWTVAFIDMTLDGYGYANAVVLGAVLFGLGIFWIRRVIRKNQFPQHCRKYYDVLNGFGHVTFTEDGQTQPESEKVEQPKAEKQTVMVTVTCEACMGITMLPVHSEGICDYCGSRIHS